MRVGADTNGLTKGMKKAESSIKGFKGALAKGLGGIKGQVAGALASIGGALVMKDAIQDAMKYEALMGTVSERLGKNTKDFVQWQKTTGNAMGLSKVQAAELAVRLTGQFKKISTSTEDLMKKTTTMMKVVGIIHTKTGMSIEEISDRVRSAMNQEADGSLLIAV